MMCRAGADADEKMLRRLIAAGANPDACDYDRRTALHLSAAEGRLTTVQLLLECGAQLDFKDRWGQTALDEASTPNRPSRT